MKTFLSHGQRARSLLIAGPGAAIIKISEYIIPDFPAKYN
jgi:hypothetical protein